MSYNTKQKDLILEIVKKKKTSFTIKDIYNDLNKEVGLTTIYRFIEKLEKDNLVTKEINEDNITYYQYLEKCEHNNHFYLKCEKCKNLTHIDCDCINELYNHINSEHKFKLNKEKIIINGICNKCQKGVKLC